MSPSLAPSYTLFGRGLALSAALASLPIITLLFLLWVSGRKPAWFAALFALLVAVWPGPPFCFKCSYLQLRR